MEYARINKVYKQEAGPVACPQDVNLCNQMKKEFTSGWEYRRALQNTPLPRKHEAQTPITENGMYESLMDPLVHNKSDLKQNYLKEVTSTYLAVAPEVNMTGFLKK